MATLFNKRLTTLSQYEIVNKAGGAMRDYLTKKEYEKLAEDLKLLVEKKKEPTSSSDYAFSSAYNGQMQNLPFLTVYTEYLMRFPKCTLTDLHALCLGYGTAGSVLDAIVESEENTNDFTINLDKKKKFH
jgi:hypothetical protein